MATAAAPGEQKLTYVHSETFSLKDHPGFDESWLEKQVREHPEILGLASAKVVHSQIQQKSGGRVDLLLKDEVNEKYYTVELMLGAVDASHIVRTMDYFLREETRADAEDWDHVAVLVAEDIRGSRFANVVEYLSRKMPLIVMELSALRVGDYVTLKSVPIFDRTQDSEEGPFEEQDEITRESWIKKSSRESVEIVDRFGEILRKLTDDLNLTYKSFIGVAVGNRPQNFVYFSPKREFVRVHVQQISNATEWRNRISGAGFTLLESEKGLKFRVFPRQFETHRNMFVELFNQAYKEWSE